MNSSRHQTWGAESLWRQLEPLLPGISVEVLAHTDSTNTRLLERARLSSGRRDGPVTRPGQLDGPDSPDELPTPHGRRAGDVTPCLLVAEQQTRGRGRLGRIWQSTPGLSLTFSLALRLAPVEWSGLSLAVGVALADALDPPRADAPVRIGLKWPNDLWIVEAPGRGRKLAGVLIETVAVGSARMCVIGIGINVGPQSPLDATSGVAHLREIDPQVSAPQALARIARPLVQVLQRFERDGFAPFVAAYSRRDLLLGQHVCTTAPGVPGGVAEGVDAHGALRVRSGTLHSLVSGEVSVRLDEPAAPDAERDAAR